MKKIKQTFKFKPFSKKQRMVLNWWCDTSPVKDMDGIIADGAIRSGKTVCMSLSFVMWAMTQFNGQNFGMCGKTIGSFRRNVLFWLEVMLRSRGYTVADHRADNLVVVTRGETTNYFYIFGGKDERSQDLIQGITLAGVFFDEVALMPESFVNQATGRCSVEGSKYWFNCNPDGPYHWFKTGWIDKATGYLGKKKTQEIREKAAAENRDPGLKEILYLHFTMDDNLSLSEKIKERYRSMYTGVFYRRYIRGLWAMAEGIIYDMFDTAKHVISNLSDPVSYTHLLEILPGSDIGNTIIKALEELKQYRTIGTPEECQKSVAVCKAMIARKITPENMEEYMKFEDECVKCGFTLKSLLEAREKQIPYKLSRKKLVWGVGKCKCGVEFLDRQTGFCGNCGQKLDWEGER